MRQPTSIDDARAMVREEKAKVTTAVSNFAGSRWATAILATLVIAFGVNLIYSPTQLPTFGDWSVARVGLPEGRDFGLLGEQAVQAREAAEREEVVERGRTWADQNPTKVPIVNAVGVSGALVLLLTNMWIMTKRRRHTRG